ncbi:MAG: FAD-dependent oxidoreductase [Gammaproteobacteria bacterium]|nr:FAD-dependent oxidoreductase [Gammaproteobacteria bacterium]
MAAYIAATVKAEVTLVEKHLMGGDCLNTGCVPSKALIKTARVMHQTRHLADYGIEPLEPRVNFAAAMDRVHDVIKEIEPHDSVERYTNLGVDCRAGHARLVSPWEVEITSDGQTERLTTRNVVIAMARARWYRPFQGLDAAGLPRPRRSSGAARACRNACWSCGGARSAAKLSQAFVRLGSQVTQVEMQARLMSRDDPEASDAVLESLRADGVDVRLNTTAARFAVEDGESVLYADAEDGEVRIAFDQVLVALGRRANTEGLGLEALGIETRDNGTLVTDEYLETTLPGIYACGDVAGPFQFTHTASHQASTATVNALFGTFRRFKADYSVIPWTTFTDPEVAHVGMTEADAREHGIDLEITRYDIGGLDRAIADGTASGFVKVITRKGSDRILGATIVGADAGNLIAEFIVAMSNRIGLKRLQGAIHVYPTLSESVKFAAGEWRKAHAPGALLEWVGKFHRWRLGSGAMQHPPGGKVS